MFERRAITPSFFLDKRCALNLNLSQKRSEAASEHNFELMRSSSDSSLAPTIHFRWIQRKRFCLASPCTFLVIIFGLKRVSS